MPQTISFSGTTQEQLQQLAEFVGKQADRVFDLEARTVALEVSLHGALVQLMSSRGIYAADDWSAAILKTAPVVMANIKDEEFSARVQKWMAAYRRKGSLDAEIFEFPARED